MRMLERNNKSRPFQIKWKGRLISHLPTSWCKKKKTEEKESDKGQRISQLMFVFITEYSQSIPQYLIILLIHYLIPRTYFCSYLLVCFNNHIMGIKSESPFYLGTTSQALKIDDRLTGCQLSSSVDELFSVTHSKEILFSKDTS